MAKYQPTDVPPGETKRICDMTATEYRSWRGRCGGKSKSKAKLRSQKRAAKSKKPGLATYHALVKRIATEHLFTIDAIKKLSTDDYHIGGLRATMLLNAARSYAQRNPIQ